MKSGNNKNETVNEIAHKLTILIDKIISTQRAAETSTLRFKEEQIAEIALMDAEAIEARRGIHKMRLLKGMQ